MKTATSGLSTFISGQVLIVAPPEYTTSVM
jgi:hypothetical protein